MYIFLALAKKAVGDVEESNLILSELANDNFATWQNAIVKNLAKSQIKNQYIDIIMRYLTLLVFVFLFHFYQCPN